MTNTARRRPPVPLRTHVAALSAEQRVIALSLRREAKAPTVRTRTLYWCVGVASVVGFVLGISV